VSAMSDFSLLREVSRSFYLSLRVLPGPMRDPVALAYLLARASDTLADTEAVDPGRRIALLRGFEEEIRGGDPDWRADLGDFLDRQRHAGERVLLERLREIFATLDRLGAGEAAEVREVVATICGGQALDLERFGGGPAALAGDAELRDYCHRVAGCVGVFWTRVGFLTLGGRFSRCGPAALEALGERHGRGLQLVNILRDLPKDHAAGRGYLPGVAPGDRAGAQREAARWRGEARDLLAAGRAYAAAMRPRRLKVAAGLPARLGGETLDRLDRADWETLAAGVKVPRRRVWRNVLAAAWAG